MPRENAPTSERELFHSLDCFDLSKWWNSNLGFRSLFLKLIPYKYILLINIINL